MSTSGHGKSASKRSRNQEVVGTAVDRISNLPESVLLHILSFLPALHVARTCILSRRWQNVWTCVPCLDFEHEHKYFKGRLTFVNFINSFLLQYKAGSIKKFRASSLQDATFEAWIRWAIDRNVEELDSRSFRSPLHLPQTTFGCKTLVVLKLKCHQVSMTFPPAACIPCLKTLKLDSLTSPDDEFENKLISCCVVLENLSIRRASNVGVKSYRIHAHQLKRLKIKFEHIYNRNGKGYVIDISTPILKDLDIKGYAVDSLLLADVGTLSKANIYLDNSNAFQSLLECFSALINVKSLCLSSNYPQQACKLEQGLTVHNVNLTRLTLGARSVWVQLLPYFFHCFPNLEVLTIKKSSHDGGCALANLCIDPELLPEGLLSCLRVFDAEEFRETEEELAMLKYILKNGKVLDLVQLQYVYSHQIDEECTTRKGTKAREFEEKYLDCEDERCELEEKFRVAQKILSFPRQSQKCEVKFS